MNSIQQLIIDTYTEKPKHFTQILKRNSSVTEYIRENVPAHITEFLEQLYYVVYHDDGVCGLGNKRKLKSFSGYTFCGKTGVCECARRSVSKSVSESKKAYTDEKKASIRKKTIETVLREYGTVNVGLIPIARQNHSNFYSDAEKVAEAVEKARETKDVRYGDKNYNNRKKAEDTCMDRYGVKNTWSLTEEKQNPTLDILRDKDQLMQIFPKFSVAEIAERYKLHEQTIYWYLNKHNLREPYKSTFEKEIIYFLESLGVENIVTNKRNIIGKELDIFLPDYNLAIEYNGVYWHHDKIQHITKDYHYDKFIACEELGIELFTIFSDSWEAKKEVWKSKIKSKLGTANKIYARCTNVVELTSSETREILDSNHIQGYCPAQYCYGLVHNDELVAAMTFSKHRNGIGKDRGEGSYELVRFVTSKTVVGGASKLLKHFIKTHSPSLIVSYSDNKYSVGNLYKTLGFTLEKSNRAGYGYYSPKEKKMYHRYKFAKHNLVKQGFDSSLTEFEITDSLGLLRVWDCGTKTWVLPVKK